MNYKSIRKSIVAAIMPLVFFVITIWDIYWLVHERYLTSESLQLTILDYSNGGVAGFVVYQLFYIPVSIVVFDKSIVFGRTWEIIRYSSRNVFSKTLEIAVIKYSFIYALLIELMKVILLLSYIPLNSWAENTIWYFGTDILMTSMYFCRALFIYLIILTLTNSRGLSIVITVAGYFLEFVIFSYVFYQTVFCPCYTLTIAFRIIAGEIESLSIVFSVFCAIVLTLILLLVVPVLINKKDLIERER